MSELKLGRVVLEHMILPSEPARCWRLRIAFLGGIDAGFIDYTTAELKELCALCEKAIAEHERT
jgi:hypothetical protein